MAIVESNHVVIVCRTGDHNGAGIFLTAPCHKLVAIHSAELQYRAQKKLDKSIALLSVVSFSGNERDCRDFMLRLDQKLKEKEKKDNGSTNPIPG